MVESFRPLQEKRIMVTEIRRIDSFLHFEARKQVGRHIKETRQQAYRAYGQEQV